MPTKILNFPWKIGGQFIKSCLKIIVQEMDLSVKFRCPLKSLDPEKIQDPNFFVDLGLETLFLACTVYKALKIEFLKK